MTPATLLNAAFGWIGERDQHNDRRHLNFNFQLSESRMSNVHCALLRSEVNSRGPFDCVTGSIVRFGLSFGLRGKRSRLTQPAAGGSFGRPCNRQTRIVT